MNALVDISNKHRETTNKGCYIDDIEGNEALAFGIVIAAGLSTAVGAILSFFLPQKSSSKKNLPLASFLSIAAGVMIYVSFVEIFAFKAVPNFERCFKGLYKKYAILYATLCFFSGILITALFEKISHIIQGWYHKKKKTTGTEQRSDPSIVGEDLEDQKNQNEEQETGEADEGEIIASMYTESPDSARLIRMGIFAAVALAFHNFPEGLATYVAVLDNPGIGASVGIATAIHNIPEGICVAMPIYYATGSRFKAFLWAFLSGMTELIGALLGFIVLKSVVTPEVYGVLFGIVAGMMVYISVKELLPTAHGYDPKDRVTTISFVGGMLVMALSIVLFAF